MADKPLLTEAQLTILQTELTVEGIARLRNAKDKIKELKQFHTDMSEILSWLGVSRRTEVLFAIEDAYDLYK